MNYQTKTSAKTSKPKSTSKNDARIISEKENTYDVVVFCHLRWDFVYQRPQHIISRLSQDKKVLMIEEPIGFGPGEENTAKLIKVNDGLTVLQPKVHGIENIKNILPQYLADKTIPLVWFYSAAFVPLLTTVKYDKVVYDCMDELTMFKGARPELREQEQYLLSEADIVFTGGKSLYESKAQQHKNVHCFPSSVDRAHFEKALNGIEVAPELPQGKPIVGYYGVIDERIDLKLLKETAALTPEVNFVMVGPLAKIHESDLPKAENIFYPGMSTYAKLPSYLKGFDVAMMPFALNDSTRFISPTKTLEYMAAYKPIISTPIYDVVREYGNCVDIIATPESFSTCIRKALINQKSEAKKYNEVYDTILTNTSWDNTVKNMNELINTIAA